MITVDMRTTKQKVEEFKVKAKETKDKTFIWIRENPEKAVGIVVGVATLFDIFSKGTVSVSRELRKARDIKLENCKVWDPVNGIYWYTKRPLTGTQKLEYERLVSEGFDRGKILESMGILNKRK